MKYRIIKKTVRGGLDKYIRELETEVNRLMEDGWQPLGGVSNAPSAIGYSSYIQAMIREEPGD